MRLDHIVVHVDPDPQRLHALQETMAANGYPFDAESGKISNEIKVSNIGIGNEYIEVVRLLKPNVQSWMPLWTRYFDSGERGAYCLFLEVEDVERTGTSLKINGIRARGPATLSYPGFLGLTHPDAPYTIYYLPNFPDSILHLAVMQYRPDGKKKMTASLNPNASQNGINGVRRVEIDLPSLDESLPILHKVFPNLVQEGGEWVALLDSQRLGFRQSADHVKTHIRVLVTTSQKLYTGKGFSIENLEVRTIGG